MLTFDKSQKSQFLELFECKVNYGYEIWCTYYLRCCVNIRTILKMIYLL